MLLGVCGGEWDDGIKNWINGVCFLFLDVFFKFLFIRNDLK